VWNPVTGEQRGAFQGPPARVTTGGRRSIHLGRPTLLEFSPDGNLLVVGAAMHSRVELRDVATGQVNPADTASGHDDQRCTRMEGRTIEQACRT